MTLSDLASLGILISSVAVLVSLTYLAYQIRQSTKHTRALIQLARVDRLMSQMIGFFERGGHRPLSNPLREPPRQPGKGYPACHPVGLGHSLPHERFGGQTKPRRQTANLTHVEAAFAAEDRTDDTLRPDLGQFFLRQTMLRHQLPQKLTRSYFAHRDVRRFVPGDQVAQVVRQSRKGVCLIRTARIQHGIERTHQTAIRGPAAGRFEHGCDMSPVPYGLLHLLAHWMPSFRFH